jgi:spermidine synthase
MRVVIATGISSVVTQLLTIREFLTQFQGNEIVIALILFNWLVLGGIGTLAARSAVKPPLGRPTVVVLAGLSVVLCIVAVLQVLAIRRLRDMVFIHGSSVGFYPTLLFSFLTIAPYCLLLGFVLPYSLFVLRSESADYPGGRIYITDNIGDVGGGALFSFVLVYWVNPLTALFLAHLPLLVSIGLLFDHPRRHPGVLVALVLAGALLATGSRIEHLSLAPAEGQLVFYRDTRYGRITVQQDREQFTLFEDGVPVINSRNLSLAEETIHYPLSQLDAVDRVLLISAEGGNMAELEKYSIQTVDYVELNPTVAEVQFRYKMIKNINGLQVIHQDGRAYLRQTNKKYDAIIVNLPEPNTFQVNRFFTDGFFASAARHLAKNGILSFSMQGFDNFLAEPQRQKLSSLFNTAAAHFNHVLLLPGQKVFFLCRNRPLTPDIPGALDRKNIATAYISGFFHGNVSPERIERLNGLMDPSTPRNTDTAPYLMRLMFSQWFAKFQTSPVVFFLVIATLSLIYLLRVSREEYVLFSTGCMTMGCEILVIFAFQIFFGYIYLQIGIIVTVFLAGLLPGAWLGGRLQRRGRQVLALTDGFLIAALVLFILTITHFADRLPVAFYLVFGFCVSLGCGFQFPVALHLRGGDNTAAVRVFSADLIGAACGTLLTSVVLIPYAGILGAAGGLIGLKVVSLIIIATSGRTVLLKERR